MFFGVLTCYGHRKGHLSFIASVIYVYSRERNQEKICITNDFPFPQTQLVYLSVVTMHSFVTGSMLLAMYLIVVSIFVSDTIRV